jgi:large subunit ribosomal protein L25
MKHPVLNASPRSVLGKNVKKLRREGLLPANVYGKGLNSQALQLKLADFHEVYNQAGETGVIDLTVEEKVHPVMIKNLQMDYSNNSPLHADFYQVNLKEKVKAMVPIELIGEAKAVTEKIGILLQTISEVEVEALPDRVPEQIEASVESLAEIGDGITVGDLKTTEGITILTDTGVTIARIAEPQKEEPVEAPAEEPKEEGEAVTEGTAEEPTSDKKEPEATEEKK